MAELGQQAATAAAGGALTCTYITLQLLLRRGLAEPSRADHFAAAHGARSEGSRARHRRGRWRQWTRSGHGRHTQPRGPRSFPRRGGQVLRALGRLSSLSLLQIRGPKRNPSGAAGIRARRPSFSVPSWPPGAAGPPRQRSGSAGTRPGPGARSSMPSAPPLGDRTSRERSLLRTPRCTRTHNARSRCPLRSARWRFQ